MADSEHIPIENHLESIRLGIVRVDRVNPKFRSQEFDASLARLLARRASGLDDKDDAVRKDARDMLRNGQYKPTGRGKPASEYLLRAAADASGFPRINWPVDICNYISLSSLLPVSIWDLDKTSGEGFVFRLGRPNEKYTFDPSGQEISLEDLVVGCEFSNDRIGSPIVNPIKDSLRTKTTDDTRRVMACIYAPAEYPESELFELCRTFLSLLEQGATSPAVSGVAVIQPGAAATC